MYIHICRLNVWFYSNFINQSDTVFLRAFLGVLPALAPSTNALFRLLAPSKFLLLRLPALESLFVGFYRLWLPLKSPGSGSLEPFL